MDEYQCECDIFPVPLQIGFWMLISTISAVMNIMFIKIKFYDALTRLSVPFWIWALMFISWYISFPFIIYYGIQKPNCGLSWEMLVFVGLYIFLSTISASFFKFKNLIMTTVLIGISCAFMIALIIILSDSVEWWFGIIIGIESCFMILFFIFFINLSMNPLNINIIKYYITNQIERKSVYNYSEDNEKNILRTEI